MASIQRCPIPVYVEWNSVCGSSFIDYSSILEAHQQAVLRALMTRIEEGLTTGDDASYRSRAHDIIPSDTKEELTK